MCVFPCVLSGTCLERISVGHVMMCAAVRQNWVTGRWRGEKQKTQTDTASTGQTSFASSHYSTKPPFTGFTREFPLQSANYVLACFCLSIHGVVLKLITDAYYLKKQQTTFRQLQNNLVKCGSSVMCALFFLLSSFPSLSSPFHTNLMSDSPLILTLFSLCDGRNCKLD